MGDPLSIGEVMKILDRMYDWVQNEVFSGRLPVKFIFFNEMLFDSEQIEQYQKEYGGNNWMNEAEIARYLGIKAPNVVSAFHKYESASIKVTPSDPFSVRLYNIDSPVFQKILQVQGWDKYARPDGHKEGKSFSSEHERREYARSGRRDKSAKKRKRVHA